VTDFAYSAASPLDSDASLVIAPVFEGPEAGPGVKGTGLLDAYVAAKLTGKKGQNLLIPRRGDDTFAAGAVLLVGVGRKDGFDVTAIRRTLGAVAGTARRFGSVATTFALAARPRHAADAVQAAAEGLGLGA
jgi:leucyl aminopeptidase